MSDNKPEQTAAKLAGGPACACTIVIYNPIKDPDGGYRERWRCQNCGSEFIKDRPALPRLAMTREQLGCVADNVLKKCAFAQEFSDVMQNHIVSTFLPYLDSETPQPPEPQPATVEAECPEVDVQLSWGDVSKVFYRVFGVSVGEFIPMTNSHMDAFVEVAQHFQQRGFELGRAEATKEDSGNGHKWHRKHNELQQQLKSVSEERDRLKESLEKTDRRHREAGIWQAPDIESQPITAVAGPPTMEALEAAVASSEDAVCVWGDSAKGLHLAMVGWYLDSGNNRSRMSFAKWHVFVTPPEPPKPEMPDLPKCPECGIVGLEYGESGMGNWKLMICDNCGWRTQYCKTESEAIKSARAAGEGSDALHRTT